MRGTAAALLTLLLALGGCDEPAEPDAGPGDDAGPGMTDAGGDGTDAGGDDVDAGDDMDAGGDDDAGTTDGGTTDGGMTDGGMDAAMCTVERTWFECTDGLDNDCDGATDTDEGCSVCPPAAAPEAGAEATDAFCGDGIDNECNGFVDCSDAACDGFAACAAEDTDALCADGIDNDGDDRVDCAQRACAATTSCRPATMTAEEDATACGNGLDDDYDGTIDCDDDSCDALGFCGAEDTDAACMDGNDNDGNGYVDCRDFGCRELAYCTGEDTDAACTDGIDNDHDGWVDCRDAACIDLPVYRDAETACSDTMDNDLDGVADCQDSDCAGTCAATPCSETNWFGMCTAPATCARGACAVPLSTFTFPGDQPLLITEIMPNPATLSDNDAEYVEVTNVSSDTLNLAGLTISDGEDTETIADPRALAPGATLVFAASTDTTGESSNGGIIGALLSPMALSNSGDEVEIGFAGAAIHRVTYPGTGNDLENVGSSDQSGQSFNLDQAYIDGTSTTAMWCLTPEEAANDYVASDEIENYGTPGAMNVACAP